MIHKYQQKPGPRPDPDDPEGPELPDETPFVPIKDLEAPYVIFTSPTDNTSGIVTSANISITFSEEVVRGTGKIKISELTTNELFEEIDVENKEQVEFLGTDTIRINPTNNLKSGTEYFVNMTRGTVSDPSGNKFAGIAGTETYNFSTREVSAQQILQLVLSLDLYQLILNWIYFWR